MSVLKAIDISESLQVKANKIIGCLRVSLGQKINQGDLLALKKTVLAKKKVYSPISGVLERIEESTGRLIIKQIKDENKNPSKNKKPVKIDKSNKVKGIFGFGKVRGKLIYIDCPFCLEKLQSNVKDRILAAPSLDSRGALFKAAALDIGGLVLGYLSPKLQTELEAIKEEIGFSLLALSSDKTNNSISFLKKYNHKLVELDGDKNLLAILKNSAKITKDED